MEETKKWWQSRTIKSAIALVVGAVGYLATTFSVVDPVQLQNAATVYPEVEKGIALIHGGQLLAGISGIVGVLVFYFRTQASKLIA